jgi:hypothetical protein
LGRDELTTLSVDSSESIGLFQRLFLKKLGANYLVVITITGVSEEKLEEIVALFEAYD